MHHFAKFSAAALGLSLALGASAQTEAETVADLRSAASQVNRIELLQDDQFVFDFLHSAVGETTGAGGHTVAASSTTFPALIGNGMAMTIGFLGPCGYNTPHTHPRATEFNFAVNGTLQTGFLAENGARFVFNEVPAGSAAIFPKGAIHFEMNNGCEDMMFVAAFNDEDPGVDQVAQRFFGLPPAFVAASLGDIGVQQIAELESMIPDNVALGTDECLQRCGLSRSSQPTEQRQPRVSANALPSGFSGPTPPAGSSPTGEAPVSSPTSVATSSAPVQQPTSSSQSTPHGAGSFSGALDGEASDKPNSLLNPLAISLIVVCSVLVIGYIALAGAYFWRRRNERMSRTKGEKYFQPGSEFAPQAAIFEAERAEIFAAEKRLPFESYENAGSSQERLSTPYDPPSDH